MDHFNHLFNIDDIVNVEELPPRRKQSYQPNKHLQLFDDVQFKAMYRMKKSSFWKLHSILKDNIAKSARGGAIPTEHRLLMTIRFLAEGCVYRSVSETEGCSIATVCRVVTDVVRAIASLRSKFIKLPTPEEIPEVSSLQYRDMGRRSVTSPLAQVKKQFQVIANFPGIIGVLDGTHIPFMARGNDKEGYINRKYFKSFNVQVLTGPTGLIYDIVCRWPGSVNDSRIFYLSALCEQLELNHYEGWILADGAYKCTLYMLTPIKITQQRVLTAAEKKYQKAHAQTRNVVERTFGE